MTKVLIVGGSVVGASAALFLAARGITPVLVEKHPQISTRLRARLFYPRTMEAYRAVGADRDIYAIQNRNPPSDHLAEVVSLAGQELRRWQLPAAADFSDVTPCPSAFVKQADLEEVVRAHAHAAGADLRFGHRFVALRQDGEHVVATVLDADGQPYTVTADYVLAADGHDSGIREALGIGRSGTEVVAKLMEVSFEADLREVLAGRPIAMAQSGRAFMSWNAANNRGIVSVRYETEAPPDLCRDIALRALGLPASAVTFTGMRPWQMSACVADSYRVGRVFLLGDAAHVTPPTGGFGANTGIQDAWNLTSKLVSVLRGDAHPRLLDDYESERRPVAQVTVAKALQILQLDPHPTLSEAAVAIGYRYRMPGDDPALPEFDEPGRWHGEPGSRLPHVPLPDGRSTLDLVQDGRYLLLTDEPADVFLDVAPLPAGLSGPLLVRPDHVVAWRGDIADVGKAVEMALGWS